MKKTSGIAWLWLLIVGVYLFVPLIATLIFSLEAESRRGIAISLKAYTNVLTMDGFVSNLSFSFGAAILTIIIATLLLVPTTYWVHLKMPFLLPVLEFMTLLPIVIPAVVLVFGLETMYNRTFLTNSAQGLYWLMLGAYIVTTFPYAYRPINTAFQAINVKVLTEAAESLGSSWFRTLFEVIFPNIWVGVLNAAFITFAIVMGEFAISSILGLPSFSVLMYAVNENQVYEPAALAIISFGITWLSIAILQYIGRRRSDSVSDAR
jgi:putative spermidine/putrescine transport system permease protein